MHDRVFLKTTFGWSAGKNNSDFVQPLMTFHYCNICYWPEGVPYFDPWILVSGPAVSCRFILKRKAFFHRFLACTFRILMARASIQQINIKMLSQKWCHSMSWQNLTPRAFQFFSNCFYQLKCEVWEGHNICPVESWSLISGWIRPKIKINQRKSLLFNVCYCVCHICYCTYWGKDEKKKTKFKAWILHNSFET